MTSSAKFLCDGCLPNLRSSAVCAPAEDPVLDQTPLLPIGITAMDLFLTTGSNTDVHGCRCRLMEDVKAKVISQEPVECYHLRQQHR